jgi:hypothetical protein
MWKEVEEETYSITLLFSTNLEYASLGPCIQIFSHSMPIIVIKKNVTNWPIIPIFLPCFTFFSKVY